MAPRERGERSRNDPRIQLGKLLATPQTFHRYVDGNAAFMQRRRQELAVLPTGEDDDGADIGEAWIECAHHPARPFDPFVFSHGVQRLLVWLDNRIRIDHAVFRGKYVPGPPGRFDDGARFAKPGRDVQLLAGRALA